MDMRGYGGSDAPKVGTAAAVRLPLTRSRPRRLHRSTPPPPAALLQGIKQYTVDKLCSDVAAVITAAGHAKACLVRCSWYIHAEAGSVRLQPTECRCCRCRCCGCRWPTTGAAPWPGTWRCCTLRQCLLAPPPVPPRQPRPAQPACTACLSSLSPCTAHTSACSPAASCRWWRSWRCCAAPTRPPTRTQSASTAPRCKGAGRGGARQCIAAGGNSTRRSSRLPLTHRRHCVRRHGTPLPRPPALPHCLHCRTACTAGPRTT